MLRRTSCRAKSSPVTYSAIATSNLNPEPGARYASATSRASRRKNATPKRPRFCARFFSRGDTLQDINGIGVDAYAFAGAMDGMSNADLGPSVSDLQRISLV